MESEIWKEIIKELRKVGGSWIIDVYNPQTEEKYQLCDNYEKGVRIFHFDYTTKDSERRATQKEFLKRIENFSPYEIAVSIWDTKTHPFEKFEYPCSLELLAFLSKDPSLLEDLKKRAKEQKNPSER